MSLFYSAGLGGSAIPDNVKHQFDARDLSLADGETVSSWGDSVGALALTTNDDPTFRESQINGNPAVVFRNDVMDGALSISEPMTVIFVARANTTVGKQGLAGYDSTSDNIFDAVIDGNEVLSAENGDAESSGTADTNYHIYTFKRDSTESVIRKDGSQIAPADVTQPSQAYDIFVLGDRSSNRNISGEWDIAHASILDSPTDSDIQAVESELSTVYEIPT